MNMDPDSPLSRVERTLWTVWAYITGAVNRFLRPQPANDVYNDPNSFQESAVDCEPSDCGPAEGDVGREGVDEEQPLAAAAQLSSSRSVVVWELSPTDIHLEPNEERVRYQTQSSRSGEKQESTDSEEQISQTHDDEKAKIREDEPGKTETEGFGAQGQTSEDDGQHVDASEILLDDDGMREDVQKSEGEVGDEEETVTSGEHQEIHETVTKTHVQEVEGKIHHEGEQDLKAGEVKLCAMADSSPEEEKETPREEADVQKDDTASVATKEEAETCDGVVQLVPENKSDEGTKQEESQVGVCEAVSDVLDDELIAVGQEDMLVGRRESDTFEDDGVKEDEQEEENNEATSIQTTDEEPEQEQNITTVTDDSQEENILTEREEAVRSTETWLQPAELTDIEQEDVAVTQVQSKTTDVATACISLDDKDQAEEERLSSEVSNKDVEAESKSTSVTVKPEGETGQEMSGELGNTPPGISEGQVVVSQQLNTPACEETQERLPGYNNELGPDENTTQRFLEVGDYEETPTTWLPEEVESKEQESLQNSGWSTGADYLLVKEPMEEKQEGTKGLKNSLETGIQQLIDTGLTQETENPCAEPLESRHLSEGKEGKLLESSMKTEIKHTGLSEELLVDFGIHGGFCDSKEADAGRAVAADEAVGFGDKISEVLEAEMQKITETSFSQESVLDVQTEPNSSRTPTLLEDVREFGFLRPLVEIEPESSLEMTHAEIILEEIDHGKEEEAEDETHLQEAGTAPELITEVKEKGNNLITESVLSQSPDKALEISEEKMITEIADELKTTEFKPKDSSAGETAEHVRESDWSHTEETSDPISGHQDVIDEEILDLWIEAAMSTDTDGIKQEEEPEPRQQIDTETDCLNEKQGGIRSEEDKEQLMEPNSGESGVASDTEMSLSTVECEFFNQSISEWDTQNSETQLPKSASTGSLHDIQDMLVSPSQSADISEFSPNSESKDGLIEETAERMQSYLKEETGFYLKSPEERNLNQDFDESQEKTDEERIKATSPSPKEINVEVTNRAEKTDWKDNEEVDVTSLTKMSTFFQIEETKVKNEPLEISVSDSTHETKHTESRSGSEASLEEEIVSVEPDSQDKTWTEKRLLKLPSLEGSNRSETESLSKIKRPEEADEPMTTSDDQQKVVAPVLDFTLQRSRIAVKNPRVRPPKDPRSLLHMPSVDPTPSTHVPLKAPKGVPLGGLGIGIKLPGLGAGFPVLKKTQWVVKEENSQETLSQQEPEVKPEEKSEVPQQDETQHKPKWMPPRHPGFGNPLMSELKNKLKKTTQEPE